MIVHEDQKLIEMQKIKRKLLYCGIPVILAFLGVVASEIVGLSISNADPIFSSSGFLWIKRLIFN
ncbi:hypothetical protein A1507_16165 [Methylomonas koyamae]|uniref:Uncharacterized protein n=1 Tax=Methylomonas koyamae TaxID=702114 RepID=A0A177N7I1_9GAMM|nr:hypothetical protein A1507_16165 [Methylomonas koyamae]